jgi:hypothetical protein
VLHSAVDSYYAYPPCYNEAEVPARSFVFQSKLTTVMGHTVISSWKVELIFRNWTSTLVSTTLFASLEIYIIMTTCIKMKFMEHPMPRKLRTMMTKALVQGMPLTRAIFPIMFKQTL